MFKTFSNAVTVTVIMVLLTACSNKSSEIAASYISPMQYSSLNCSQLREELNRINSRAQAVFLKQDETAQKDAIATGVGLVLFWPALFFIPGGDQKAEVARLKGEIEAIERLSIRKDCDRLNEGIKSGRVTETRKKINIEDKLRDLRELRNKGLITDSQYESLVSNVIQNMK